MSLPDIRVEVGFTGPFVGTVFLIGDPTNGRIGAEPIGSGDVWVDISPYLRSWSTRRGASEGNQPTRRYDPGTAVIVLNDGDRRFDADNLDGPYVVGGVSMIQPMCRVRITASWAGVAYAQYSGNADSWVPEYQTDAWTYTTLTVTDATKIWAATDRTAAAPVGGGELTGARINRVLDSIGWPATERLIDGGSTAVLDTDLSGNGLTELQLVQDSELGEMFVDALGRAVFLDRASALTRPASIDSQATFGDSGWMGPVAYDFESGIAGWAVSGGTEAATSSAHTGTGALSLTVSGSPVQAYVRPPDFPVVVGHRYSVTMWVNRSATGSVLAAIDWKDGAHNYLGGSYPSFTPSAGVWTQITVTAAAPAGAAYIAFGPTLDGSPANGTVLLLDDITMVDVDAEIPYAEVALTSQDDALANRVTITRAGGTPQTAEDATSQSQYLIKAYSPGDLIMQTDGEALDRAEGILYRFKDPVRRFARIDFRRPAKSVEATAWPILLGLEFGDLITVVRRPAGGGDPITGGAFIRGVEQASDGQQWTTGFILQAADRLTFFTIGNADRGRIGAYAIAF